MILALDSGRMLLDCLAAVGPNRGDAEVIVVDNGSTDGMVAKATALYPRIRALRNETNAGFATGSNQGAALASGRYLLFLNTDAVVPPGGLERLVETADADATAAFWQPVIVAPDGEIEAAGEYFTWSGFFIRDRRSPPVDAPPLSAFSATAACLLVRREAFEELGGFRDDYFAYMEDLDLCWRARLRGWEVRVVPSVRVTHMKSQTSREVFSPEEFRFVSYRNRFRTILANASGATLVRIVPVFVLVSLVAAFVLAVSGRWRRAVAILRGLAWPLAHREKLAGQRRNAGAIRRHSDRAVLRPELRARAVSREGWRVFCEYNRT